MVSSIAKTCASQTQSNHFEWLSSDNLNTKTSIIEVNIIKWSIEWTHGPDKRFALHDTINRLHRNANVTALVPPTNTFPNTDNLFDDFGVFEAQSVKNRRVENLPTASFKWNDELIWNLDAVCCNVLWSNKMKLIWTSEYPWNLSMI